MIDEFQDTSGMQWSNFRPLVEESLAQGQENLIVGDVKHHFDDREEVRNAFAL